MEYYDWLIILNALILIGFLTLFGLALLEKGLKKKDWILWFSVAGLVFFILITGILVWYFYKKAEEENGMKKKQKEGMEDDKNEMIQNKNKELTREEKQKYKDQILTSNFVNNRKIANDMK